MNNMRITLDELWLRMLEEDHYKDNDFIRERLDNLKGELPTGFDGWIKPWHLEHRFPQARFVFALCCLGMKIYKKGSNDFLNNSDVTYKKIASNLEEFEVEKPDLADTLQQYGLFLPDFWFRDEPSNDATVVGENVPWWHGKSTEEILDKLRKKGIKEDRALAQELQFCGVTLVEIGRVLRPDGHFDSEDANKKRAQRLLEK